ncbi:metal ABC transporter substrate-binding protein [Oceanithermus sp.]
MKRLLFAIVLFSAAALAAKPLAVATIEPYASLARAVLGDGWRVESLVPAGANPHVFSPTPADVRKVAAARLVIMNGLGLDDWLIDKLVKPNNLQATVYRAADSLKGRTIALPSGAPDPHVWTDPVLMTFVVCDIARAAGRLDPEHADDYLTRAREYKQKLFEIAQMTAARLEQAPTRKFVAFKNPFSYVAARYQLERVYLITPNPAAEPSPRELAAAARVLQQNDLHYILAPMQTAREAEQVAATLGVQAALIDILGETGVDYLGVWEANGRILAMALGIRE